MALWVLFSDEDEKGAWKMAEVPGSEKTYKCQMVLLAMGFLGPEKYVLDQLELEKDGRGNIKTPAGQYASNIPGVFAAGDCRRGKVQMMLSKPEFENIK